MIYVNMADCIFLKWLQQSFWSHFWSHALPELVTPHRKSTAPPLVLPWQREWGRRDAVWLVLFLSVSLHFSRWNLAAMLCGSPHHMRVVWPMLQLWSQPSVGTNCRHMNETSENSSPQSLNHLRWCQEWQRWALYSKPCPHCGFVNKNNILIS